MNGDHAALARRITALERQVAELARDRAAEKAMQREHADFWSELAAAERADPPPLAISHHVRM